MISLAVFLSTSIYEIFAVPLYLRIIYVLIKNKAFSTPFFRFIWVIGICEIIHYVADVVYYRLPMFEPTADWFDKSPSRGLPCLAAFLVYFFNYPVYFLQIAASLNRLTAVWWPLKYKIVWQKLCNPVIFASFLLSLLLCAHRLPWNATAQLVPFVEGRPELGYITLLIKYDYYSVDSNLVTIFYDSIAVLLCFVTNVVAFVKIRKLPYPNKIYDGTAPNSSSSSQQRKVEMKLLLIVFWLTCTLIITILIQLAYFILRNELIGWIDNKYYHYMVFMYQPWIDDIGALTHPWVLILMSQQIRDVALPFVRKLLEKKRIEVVTLVKTTQ